MVALTKSMARVWPPASTWGLGAGAGAGCGGGNDGVGAGGGKSVAEGAP